MRISLRCDGLVLATVLVMVAGEAAAQTVVVVRNTNLRPEQSSVERAIRLLTPAEPPVTLVEPLLLDGYYHVRTSAGEDGYVYGRSVRVSMSATAPSPTVATTPSSGTTTIQLGLGVPGSANMVGCGDGLWEHVYHPTRLIVKQDCLTVTGTIVDATATQAMHQPDGVRHEGDTDTHGWLQLDAAYASLINDGNTSDEGGNLVFEIVCHFKVTQADAKPGCTVRRGSKAARRRVA